MTAHSSLPDRLQTREGLEKEKLQREIAELKKPFFQRPGNWISITAAIVAAGGVVGQSYLSSIKVERTLLEAKEKEIQAVQRITAAEERERQAESKARNAENLRDRAVKEHVELQAEILTLDQEKIATEAQIEAAQQSLKELQDVSAALTASDLPKELLARLESSISNTTNALSQCTEVEANAYNKALMLDEQQKQITVARNAPWGTPRTKVNRHRVKMMYQPWWIGSYDSERKVPIWVSYRLDATNRPLLRRKDCWRPDPRFADGDVATLMDFRGSGYDRGNLVPRADFGHSQVAAASVFVLTNATPQAPFFNRALWAYHEAWVREQAREYGRVFVVAGPVFDHDEDGRRDALDIVPKIGAGKVAVPSHFFKIILREQESGALKLMAFLMPNTNLRTRDFTPYIVSVNAIETLTDLDFFPDLSSDPEFKKLESSNSSSLD